jgi:hypothetical protein
MWSRVRHFVAIVIALCSHAGPLHAQTLSYNTTANGRVLQRPVTAYIIYWFPPGVIADTSLYDGFGSFTIDVDLFFGDRVLPLDVPGVSNSSYLNILTQYPASCGSPACALVNGPGAVKLGDSFIERLAYPHAGAANNAGTQANPLTDADIQAEVQRAIAARGWRIDNNSVVFVMTGVFQAGSVPVEECRGANCTFKGSSFCGYHTSMNVNGVALAYSYLSDANFNTAGCNGGITTALAGHTLSSDREIAMLSHEFAEAVTDPVLGTAWVDSVGNEIGDQCNQIPYTVSFGGYRFQVQQQWSNATSSCVSSLPAVTSVVPASGANTGGYNVTVSGGPFNTSAGGTQFFFNAVPAPSVTCASAATCVVPVPDSQGASGTVPVIASVSGFESDDQPPGPNFTYDAPPLCNSQKSCTGHVFGFPDLVLTCPTPVNFFRLAGTPSQTFVGAGNSFTFPLNEVEQKVSACAPGGSCAFFEASELARNYCGAPPPQSPRYCDDCQRAGGHCITAPTGRKICILGVPNGPTPPNR